MKKTIRNMLYALGVAIIGLFIFLVYLGLFKEVNLTTKELGPYYLAYERHQGDYMEMYATVEGVQNILKSKYKLECKRSFGIFYDNPEKVDTDKLRSDVGCLVKKSDINKIQGIPKTRIFDKKQFLFASFPYKNILSFWLGLVKVYSALEDEIKQRPNLEYMMEIYDTEGGEILYMMPIKKG